MWQSEVLKRTGKALLDIKGEILTFKGIFFFPYLAENHWARIRNLDIIAAGVDRIREDAWKFLKQSAPHMEVFSFEIQDVYSRKRKFFSETDLGLFGGHAPCLRELRLTKITFDPAASWLARLRILDLRSPFSLHQLLEVLGNTPILEKLVLQGQCVDVPHSDGKNSEIILSRLRTIDISCPLSICLGLLECISPASGCGLTLCIHEVHDRYKGVPMSSTTITRLQDIASRFSKAYFSAWRATHVYLEIDRNSFKFRGRISPDKMEHPPILVPEFNVNIYYSTGITAQGSFSIVGSLSDNLFTNVTTLAIHAYSSMPLPVDSRLTSFVVSHSSVEELRTTAHMLDLLVDMSYSLQDGRSNPAPLFPRLRTLVIEYEYDKLSITKFLSWKKEVGGQAIEVLNLRKVWMIDQADIREIQKFDGLIVLYG